MGQATVVAREPGLLAARPASRSARLLRPAAPTVGWDRAPQFVPGSGDRFMWVSFNVSADAYLRFMGRYSEQLSAPFAELAGIRRGNGCWTWDAGRCADR